MHRKTTVEEPLELDPTDEKEVIGWTEPVSTKIEPPYWAGCKNNVVQLRPKKEEATNG